jgi:adenylyltransferase/sulfurtransferase
MATKSEPLGTIAQTAAKPVTLSKKEIERYSRHLIMPEVGMEGQLKLKQAKVLCVGTGGLGAPLGLYLAAAGVGRIGLVDFDRVDDSNLQRQILFSTHDVGRPKIEAAKDRLQGLNNEIQIDTFDTHLSSENALDIMKDYDIIVDGTDNFPTRYLVNDACVILKKPNVYGSVFRVVGQVTIFGYPDGPCYRCLYPEPPPPGLVPSCAEGGVLGVLPGIVGSIQAAETLKLIIGKGESLVGRLLLFDALAMRFRELKLRKNPECPACGTHPTVTKLIDYAEFCGVRGEEAPVPQTTVPEITPRELKLRKNPECPVCGTNPTVTKLIDYEQFCGIRGQEKPVEAGIPEIQVEELKRRLDAKDDIFVLDVREPHEYQICNLGGHLIPLGDLSKRVNELDSSQEIVAHCRSGKRSAEAVEFLQRAGFRKVSSLKGGILAWSDEVDPSVPKY